MLPNSKMIRSWRRRAAEMRALAETAKEAKTIEDMQRLADDYEELADRAEHAQRNSPQRLADGLGYQSLNRSAASAQ